MSVFSGAQNRVDIVSLLCRILEPAQILPHHDNVTLRSDGRVRPENRVEPEEIVPLHRLNARNSSYISIYYRVIRRFGQALRGILSHADADYI